MKYRSMRCWVGLVPVLLVCVLPATAWAQPEVTVESLLLEMLDREQVTRFPTPDFQLRQDSSYNRESIEPEAPRDQPRGWFANRDFNSGANGRNFIRVEETQCRQEWVMMDHQGPGVLVRTWMPWRSQTNPSSRAILRVYLDGSDEPIMEGNALDMFRGKGEIPFPLAHESLRSAVSFFPIPYAKGCKVTLSEMPFFYQFTYRAYAPETAVQTLTKEQFENSSALIKQTCEALLSPTATETDKTVDLSGSLAAGAQDTLELPAGNAAVRSLSLKLGNYDDPDITRLIVLKISFDGKDTVWCPIGEFFGCGIGLNPLQGWYRTVAEDGTMTCRWVMPYHETATVSVLNLSDQPVDFELEAGVGAYEWNDRSLYFHAQWRGQYPVPTRPFSDWNYVTTQGRGVYMGDTLTIMNPVEQWWGEGDEKIFVDGEDFPSLFGTGTEDYYAYSWGGRSTDFYEHPFHAQPFSHRYNKLNRKTANEKNTQGFSTETRTRALDTMPFGSSLQLDMEVWSGTDCDMGYAVGVYWYGDKETTSNRVPEPEEALNIPPLPEAMRGE